MHDVHSLEAGGVDSADGGEGVGGSPRTPAVAIVTTAFAAQAVYQAEALGATQPERHIVLAAHPISDATPDELAAKADALYPDLLDELVAGKQEAEQAQAAEASAKAKAPRTPRGHGAPRSFRGRRILPTEDEMMSAECAAGA